MLVVLDTNVLFAGLISARGASYRILSAVIADELLCAATPALWAEYEEQLSSERFQMLTPLSAAQVNDFLNYLAQIIQPVQNDYVWRGLLLDEDDAIVVESAFNANADVVITFNVDHFVSIRDQISCQVLNPGDFLTFWRNA